MQTGRLKIVIICISGVVCSLCSDVSEHISAGSNLEKTIEKWTETEVLTQKFTAEKKFNNSLQCLYAQDDLSAGQKDSLMLRWSEHSDELNEIVSILLNKK